jgi:hypothetical protein
MSFPSPFASPVSATDTPIVIGCPAAIVMLGGGTADGDGVGWLVADERQASSAHAAAIATASRARSLGMVAPIAASQGRAAARIMGA